MSGQSSGVQAVDKKISEQKKQITVNKGSITAVKNRSVNAQPPKQLNPVKKEYKKVSVWNDKVLNAMTELQENCKILGSNLQAEELEKYGKTIHYEVSEAEAEFKRKAEYSGKKVKDKKDKDRKRSRASFLELSTKYSGVTMETSSIRSDITDYYDKKEEARKKEWEDGITQTVPELIDQLDISDDLFDFKYIENKSSHLDMVAAIRNLDILDKIEKIDAGTDGNKFASDNKLTAAQEFKLNVAKKMKYDIKKLTDAVLNEHALDIKGNIKAPEKSYFAKNIENTDIQEELGEISNYKHLDSVQEQIDSFKKKMHRAVKDSLNTSVLTYKGKAVTEKIDSNMKKGSSTYNAVSDRWKERESVVNTLKEKLKNDKNMSADKAAYIEIIRQFEEQNVLLKNYEPGIAAMQQVIDDGLSEKKDKKEKAAASDPDIETAQMNLMVMKQDEGYINALETVQRLTRIMEGVNGEKPLTSSMCKELAVNYGLKQYEDKAYVTNKLISTPATLSEEEKKKFDFIYSNNNIDNILTKADRYKKEKENLDREVAKLDELVSKRRGIKWTKFRFFKWHRSDYDKSRLNNLKWQIRMQKATVDVYKNILNEDKEAKEAKKYAWQLRNLQKSTDKFENVIGWRSESDLTEKERKKYKLELIYRNSQAAKTRKARNIEYEKMLHEMEEYKEISNSILLEDEKESFKKAEKVEHKTNTEKAQESYNSLTDKLNYGPTVLKILDKVFDAGVSVHSLFNAPSEEEAKKLFDEKMTSIKGGKGLAYEPLMGLLRIPNVFHELYKLVTTNKADKGATLLEKAITRANIISGGFKQAQNISDNVFGTINAFMDLKGNAFKKENKEYSDKIGDIKEKLGLDYNAILALLTMPEFIASIKNLKYSDGKMDLALQVADKTADAGKKFTEIFAAFWRTTEKTLDRAGLTTLMKKAAGIFKASIGVASSSWKIGKAIGKRVKLSSGNIFKDVEFDDVTKLADNSANIVSEGLNIGNYVNGGFQDKMLGEASKKVQSNFEKKTGGIVSAVHGAIKIAKGAKDFLELKKSDKKFSELGDSIKNKQKEYAKKLSESQLHEMLTMIKTSQKNISVDKIDAMVEMTTGVMLIAASAFGLADVVSTVTSVTDTLKGYIINALKRQYRKEHYQELYKKSMAKAYAYAEGKLSDRDIKHGFLHMTGSKTGTYSDASVRSISNETARLFKKSNDSGVNEANADMLKTFGVTYMKEDRVLKPTDELNKESEQLKKQYDDLTAEIAKEKDAKKSENLIKNRVIISDRIKMNKQDLKTAAKRDDVKKDLDEQKKLRTNQDILAHKMETEKIRLFVYYNKVSKENINSPDRHKILVNAKNNYVDRFRELAVKAADDIISDAGTKMTATEKDKLMSKAYALTQELRTDITKNENGDIDNYIEKLRKDYKKNTKNYDKITDKIDRYTKDLKELEVISGDETNKKNLEKIRKRMGETSSQAEDTAAYVRELYLEKKGRSKEVNISKNWIWHHISKIIF